MTNRIEQLRAEQKEWAGREIHSSDLLTIQEGFNFYRAALAEALDIADESGKEIGYLASGEMSIDVPALRNRLAEQERLLERARELLNNHHTLDPKGVAWLNEADRWLSDLDARSVPAQSADGGNSGGADAGSPQGPTGDPDERTK